MIGNVFDFADRVAREVMVPRQDMVCLFLDDTLAENMAVVRTVIIRAIRSAWRTRIRWWVRCMCATC